MTKYWLLLVLIAACGSNGSDGDDNDESTDTDSDMDTDSDLDEPDADDGSTDAPLDEWLWVDVPGSKCANGTATGIGVNHGTSDRVVVFMSGTTTCVDENCTGGTPSMRKDGGFGAAEMVACTQNSCDGGTIFPERSLFDRLLGSSPFTEDSYVFISNCTGDNYSGDSDHVFPSWTASFHGADNQALFADAIAARFPSANRIIVAGGSAGAIGAQLNYHQWIAAFPGKRVDLISDSFSFILAAGPEFETDIHNPQFPPGCASCATDYRAIYNHNSSIAPAGARLAVLDSENNAPLEVSTNDMYTEGLTTLQTRLDGLANTKYFVANGNTHVLLRFPMNSVLVDIETKQSQFPSDFLTDMQEAVTWPSRSCLP